MCKTAGYRGTARRAISLLFALVALLVEGLSVAPQPAYAAGTTYYVGTTDNTTGNTAGCTVAANATCTLRGALSLIVSGDTVRFGTSFPQGGVVDVRTGASAGYGVNLITSVTIDGNGRGPKLDGGKGQTSGGAAVGVMQVNSNLIVSLARLTIQNGTINSGAGIYNYGTLNVTGSTITGNVASGGSTGGIYNNGGTLTVTNSTISNNTAFFNGSGIRNDSSGTATITDSTIYGNTSDSDSGIRNDTGGTLTVTNSTIARNTGGGIGTHTSTPPTVTNSLIVNNTVSDTFGFTANSTNRIGSFTFADSTTGTLADNGGPTSTLAIPTNGAAYHVGNSTACGSLSSTGVSGTVYTGSLAVDQRGAPRIINGLCSIGAFEPGVVQTITTLIASAMSVNAAQNVTLTAIVSGVLGGLPTNGTVAFTNGITAISGCTAQVVTSGVATCTTNTLSVSPGTNNLTATYTPGTNYATSTSNPAIIVTVTPITCSVTSTLDPSESGKLTLRDAITAVNGGGCTGDAITFSPTVFTAAQTITLASASGTLTLNHNATLTGPGANLLTVSGGCTDCGATGANTSNTGARIFTISSGLTVTLASLTIANGNAGSSEGGGIFSTGSALTVTGSTISGNNGMYGGGISNEDGTLTVTNCIVSGNNGTFTGGGIYNLSSSTTVTITGSAITGNVSKTGGGGVRDGGTLLVTNSTISGNSSQLGAGGGIFIDFGTVAITGSTIANNAAVGTNGSGGGIYSSVGVVTVTNSTLSGNSAGSSGNGGGIFSNYVLTVTGSTLSDNTTGFSGGGISNTDGSTLTLKGSIVAGNTAPDGNIPGGSYTFNNGGGNITSGNPLLGALGLYGSTSGTQTRALLPGSPALDIVAPCPPGLMFDQRGVGRPQGASCDSGAFESQGFAFANPVGNTQSATVTTAFAPLMLTVTNSHSEPVNGGIVTFTITPASGAGATFTAPGSTGCTVSANMLTAVCPVTSGVAHTPALKAGLATGTFTVVASTAGIPANGNQTYTLTNTTSAGFITPQPNREPNGTVAGLPAPKPTPRATATGTPAGTIAPKPVRH